MYSFERGKKKVQEGGGETKKGPYFILAADKTREGKGGHVSLFPWKR